MPTSPVTRFISPQVIETACVAWPGVELSHERFADYVQERLSPGETCELAAGRLNTNDLYLACACGAGNEAALALFEGVFFSECDATLARFSRTRGLVDEVKQRVRTKLFVRAASPNDRPGIEAYSGRGSLRTWFRVVVTREALSLARRSAKEVPLEEAGEEGALAKLDPELQYLRTSCAVEFERAFHDAIAGMTREDRNLLRHHYVDGLGIDPLGVILGVHRVTASRRLNKARATLVGETRRLLAERLRLGPSDLASLLRLIDGEVEVSVRRAFGGSCIA